MVTIKSSAVPRFLKSIDPGCRAALVYGPDVGLVSERAGLLQGHFAGPDKSAEIVKLDDRDLAESDGRLEIELQTLPMFASSKVVRVRAGPRLNAASLKAILAEPMETALIVEAGNLKANSALRKLFEKTDQAVALPCYAEDRNVAVLIDEALGAAGLAIDRDTRSYLMSRLGADQALSRSEIEKLALYAAGQASVGTDDVDAVVGDSAEIVTESFVFSVSGGQSGEAIRQLGRLTAAGTGAQAALAALARHFARLYQAAAAMAEGQTEDAAVRGLRPPLHFKQRNAFIAHCRSWGATRLLAAMPLIQEATLKARLTTDLETAYAERLVLRLARHG